MGKYNITAKDFIFQVIMSRKAFGRQALPDPMESLSAPQTQEAKGKGQRGWQMGKYIQNITA